MADEVLSRIDGAVQTITLNRPDSLNALNEALMIDLRAAVESARDNAQVRALVITGAGRGFCAGADLSSFDPNVPHNDPAPLLRQRYHPVIEAIRAMAKPVITAVNGVAAGAGMSLALAGDVVLAGQSASFLQAFAKIGLIPDAGSTYFLPRYAGEVRARALALLADRVSATDAERFGLVWKVLPDDQLANEAAKLAAHMSAQPTRAYALIKQALNASLDNSLSQQLELEATLQSQASKTQDFREGVSAFLAKRTPKFSGN